MDEKVFLYRHYNEEGILLYIGIAKNVERRTLGHKQSSGKWPEKIFSTIQEEYPNRKQARFAERVAIWRENPLYNKQHSRKRNDNKHYFPFSVDEDMHQWLKKEANKYGLRISQFIQMTIMKYRWEFERKFLIEQANA